MRIFEGIPLEFIRPLEDVSLTEAPKKPVVLECELSRRPKEDVKWYKNGKPLPSRLPKNVSIDEEKGKTIHRLSLSSIGDDDLGEYSVKVENVSTSCNLEMKGTFPILPLHFRMNTNLTTALRL